MTDSLWRTDQSSLVYAVDDSDQVVQSRDEVRFPRSCFIGGITGLMPES
jgi:hypothetical protein